MEAAVGFFGLVMLFMLGMLVASVALWVWCLVDIVKRSEWQFASGSKVLWAVVVGLGGPMGALIYLLVGRPRNARAY